MLYNAHWYDLKQRMIGYWEHNFCFDVETADRTPVAGQPRTSTFIPVLQKTQKAGKNLVLFPHLDEVVRC